MKEKRNNKLIQGADNHYIDVMIVGFFLIHLVTGNTLFAVESSFTLT